MLFIAAGIVLGGRVLNLWDFTLFFDGWWTLFIIIPCAVSMIQHGFNFGSAFGFLIGVLLLLDAQSMLPFDLTGRLIFPIILIWIGLGIAFGGAFKKNDAVKTVSSDAVIRASAVFGGSTTVYDHEQFYGADLFCMFGGNELNIRNAIVEENVHIKSNVIFGGCEIFVPEDVNIKITSTPIFGGVSDETNGHAFDESRPTIFIHCMCIFGGCEVKN